MRSPIDGDDLRRQARQSASCCGECFRPLAPTDSVTMLARVPICLLCTLERISEIPWWRPQWHRTRCLNCRRPIRIYLFGVRTCCTDCQRAARNRRDKLRRRVTHQPIACVECGRSFVPKRADALTCSNRCRQALHRERTEWDGEC